MHLTNTQRLILCPVPSLTGGEYPHDKKKANVLFKIKSLMRTTDLIGYLLLPISTFSVFENMLKRVVIISIDYFEF